LGGLGAGFAADAVVWSYAETSVGAALVVEADRVALVAVFIPIRTKPILAA